MTVIDAVWIDESSRPTPDGLVYVVVGVRLVRDEHALGRLDDLLLPSQRYLHWRDESSTRRRGIVAVLNELPIDVTVAVADEVARKRQERARALCLASVVSDTLERQNPPVRFCIEGRGVELNRRDRFSVLDEVRRIGHRPTPAIEFVGKATSPLLWVADAVSSIASAHYRDDPGSDHWWRMLRPERITLLRIDP